VIVRTVKNGNDLNRSRSIARVDIVGRRRIRRRFRRREQHEAALSPENSVKKETENGYGSGMGRNGGDTMLEL
jgi:hypothetical protein